MDVLVKCRFGPVCGSACQAPPDVFELGSAALPIRDAVSSLDLQILTPFFDFESPTSFSSSLHALGSPCRRSGVEDRLGILCILLRIMDVLSPRRLVRLAGPSPGCASLASCASSYLTPHFQHADDAEHVLLVADPQILDMNSYPGRHPALQWLSQVIVDLNLRKNWRAAMRSRPDKIVFLGDMLDNGRMEMTDEECVPLSFPDASVLTSCPPSQVLCLPPSLPARLPG